MPDENTFSPIDASPQRFLRMFHGMTILLSLIILATACYIIISHSKKSLLLEAERTASRISESLIEEEMDTINFSKRNGGRTLTVKQADVKHLDLRLRMFLQPFDILKIKIYDTDQVIIFSTDQSLIGKKDTGNNRLKRALTGKPLSEIKKKKSMLDLYEEERLNVDLVESYIPIFDTEKMVAGVFEIYIDISKAKINFIRSMTLSIGYLVIALVLLNGLHYLLIRKETDQLRITQMQLKQMAITDPLTGMYNRRYVIKRLEDELAKMIRLKENSSPHGIGCIMIDVDDFKQVNDKYGHFAGDEVLCEISRRISVAVRQYDIPGRFGGEEFIVLLPDVSREEVMPVAERIRDLINSKPFPFNEISKNISVSMGVAWSPPKENIREMEIILKHSDDGLYIAKDRGKNTIVDMIS